MTMDAILAALTAALDEDERIARAARPGPWRVERTPAGTPDSCGPAIGDGNLMVPDEIYSSAPCNDHIPGPDTEHIANFDPKRALRQVEAIRRVIADYHDARDALNGLNDNQLGWEERARVNALESTLSALAGIYTEPTERPTE